MDQLVLSSLNRMKGFNSLETHGLGLFSGRVYCFAISLGKIFTNFLSLLRKLEKEILLLFILQMMFTEIAM